MKFQHIHHVAIIVSDHDAALDFYVNKLEFRVIRDNYRPNRNDWKLDLDAGDGIELEDIRRTESAQACKPPRSVRSKASGI